MTSKDQPFVILSIDGGGTRGVLPAYFLQILQSKLPLPLFEYFDLFAGTSTGSIITVLMSVRQCHYNYRMKKEYSDPLSPIDVSQMYKESMGKIFFREETKPYVSKMVGVAASIGLLYGIQRYRNSTQNEPKNNPHKSKDFSILSYLEHRYFNPTMYFFRDFFAGSNESTPGWMKDGIFNFCLFMAIHMAVKTTVSEKKLKDMNMKLKSTLKLSIKSLFYVLLFFGLLRSMSISFDGLSKNEESTETKSGSSLFGIFRHGIFVCGLSSGFSGFLSGIFSGVFRWNSASQTLRRGIAQMVLSSLFGAVSGVTMNLVYKTWISLFGKDMSIFSRLLMMIFSGSITGIFDLYLLNKVETFVQDLFSPKYPESQLPIILKSGLGETKLTDSVTNICVTSYNIATSKPVVFCHHDDIMAYKAIVASCSAPTFFKPLKLVSGSLVKKIQEDKEIKEKEKKSEERVMLDGAVWANNPSLIAYAYAKQNGIKDENIYFISLGTGRFIRQPKKIYQECGGLEWLDTVLDLSMDGLSCDSIMRAIFFGRGPRQYTRIEADLKKHIPIDVADYYYLRKVARGISERDHWEARATGIAEMLEELRREKTEKIILKPYRNKFKSEFSTSSKWKKWKK